MEEDELMHIEKNLPSLIRTTSCNTELLANLQQNGVLSREEVQQLNVSRTQIEKSKHLYDILETRAGAFQILLKALEITCQTGALKILRNKESVFHQHGKITVDKNHTLGRGKAGAIVYKGAYDEREVAVKVIVNNPSRALNEVEILRKLDQHENVVRFFAAEQEGDKIYIALEFCIITLYQEVHAKIHKPFAPFVLMKCTEGLAFLHSRGVVHGDINPDNILLNGLGQIKITDFGSARLTCENTVSQSMFEEYEQPSDWMAPEVLLAISNKISFFRKRKSDPKSDIFALGCIFYFVVTSGKHPFGDVGERQFRILKDQPVWQEIQLDDMWRNIISKMLSFPPGERPSAEKCLLFDCFPFTDLRARMSQRSICFDKSLILRASLQMQPSEPLNSSIKKSEDAHFSDDEFNKLIWDNLPRLIYSTQCTTHLLSELQAGKILTASDVSKINQYKRFTSKSKFLYQKLLKTSGFCDLLINALRQENQEKPLKILEKRKAKYKRLGQIVVDKRQVLETVSQEIKIYQGTFKGVEATVKVLNSNNREAIEFAELHLKTLNNDNIIQCLGFETDKNHLYVALERGYISLQDEVNLKLFNTEHLKILRYCTRGLVFLHKHGVIHGNMNPNNILLNHLGHVKLSDFGFLKQVSIGDFSSSYLPSKFSPEWMAPEILNFTRTDILDEKFQMDSSSDVFTLGCIFCFVLTSGSHPFGESPSEQTYGIINDTPNIPEHLLNSPCGRHLPNMLQHKPTYRPTASQILEILEQMDDREFQTSTKKSITKPMLQEKLVLNSFLTKKPSMKIPRVVFNPFLDKTVLDVLFGYLPLQSLKSCRLVHSIWNKIGSPHVYGLCNIIKFREPGWVSKMERFISTVKGSFGIGPSFRVSIDIVLHNPVVGLSDAKFQKKRQMFLDFMKSAAPYLTAIEFGPMLELEDFPPFLTSRELRNLRTIQLKFSKLRRAVTVQNINWIYHALKNSPNLQEIKLDYINGLESFNCYFEKSENTDVSEESILWSFLSLTGSNLPEKCNTSGVRFLRMHINTNVKWKHKYLNDWLILFGKHLEVLELRMGNNLIQNIPVLPNLKRLQIDFQSGDPFFSGIDYREKLPVLQILSFRNIDLKSLNFAFHQAISTTETVVELEIWNSCLNIQTILNLSRLFPKIRKLTLSPVDSLRLQNIAQNLTCLEELSLGYWECKVEESIDSIFTEFAFISGRLVETNNTIKSGFLNKLKVLRFHRSLFCNKMTDICCYNGFLKSKTLQILHFLDVKPALVSDQAISDMRRKFLVLIGPALQPLKTQLTWRDEWPL